MTSPSAATLMVLCGYCLHDAIGTTGAVMIHVAHLRDIEREFKLVMEQKAKFGWFGKFPPTWDLIWCRTPGVIDYPKRKFSAMKSVMGSSKA